MPAKPWGESERVKREIAVRMAAGQGVDETAKAVRRNRRTVANVRADINKGRDPGMVAVYEEAKERITAKLLKSIEKHVDTVDTEMNGDAPLRDKAQGLRVLFDGLESVHSRPNEVAGGVVVQFDLKDPAVMASVFQALRTLNEPREIDVTPPVGAVEPE